MEDALRYSFQEMGMGNPEIEGRLGSMRNASGEFEARQAGAEATRVRNLSEEARSNFLLYRAKDKVSDVMKDVTDQLVAPMSNFVDRTMAFGEDFYQRQTEGIVRANVKGVRYEDFDGTLALAPGSLAEKARGAIDIDVGGSFFSRSAGEKLSTAVAEGKLAAFGLTTSKLKADQEAGPGQVIVDQGFFGNKTVVEREQLENAVAASRVAIMSVGEAEKMKQEGKLKDMAPGLTNALRAGKVTTASSIEEVSQGVFGKDLSKLSRKEYASLLLEAQSFPEMKELLDNVREGAIALQPIDDAIAVQQHTQNLEDIQKAKASTEQKLGGMNLSDEAFNLMSLAKAKRSRDPKEAQRLLDEAVKVQSIEAQRQGIFNNQTTGEITKAVSRFMEEDVFTADAAVVQRAAGDIARVQVKRGVEALSSSINVDLKTSKLTADEQEKIQGAISKLKSGRAEDLMNMPEEDVALLKETMTGRALLQQRDVVTRISALQDNQAIQATRDPGERRELFLSSMENLKGVSEEQISKLADTFVNRGSQAAAQQAFTSFTSTVAGDVVTAAPGGGNVETAKGTAEENMALQTNINLQVLTALSALAAQLNNRK